LQLHYAQTDLTNTSVGTSDITKMLQFSAKRSTPTEPTAGQASVRTSQLHPRLIGVSIRAAGEIGDSMRLHQRGVDLLVDLMDADQLSINFPAQN
jgi:hypothetical protein